jgi:diguanylate cyclase (GGDEF)-like protein
MQVADRIAASVRSSDVVARLGGDEFAVLCAGVPDIETAMRIGRSVLASVSREFDLSETRARVGASIGVAVAVDGDTGPELLHAADQAMYEAKRAGKGTVLFNERAR